MSNRRRRPSGPYRPQQSRMPDDWNDSDRPVRPARQPQDHRRTGPAARAEVDDRIDLTFDWRGRTWHVQADKNDLPVELIEAFEDGKIVKGCRVLLGERQWAAFMALNPKRSDLDALLDPVARALGFTDAGE